MLLSLRLDSNTEREILSEAGYSYLSAFSKSNVKSWLLYAVMPFQLDGLRSIPKMSQH